MRSVWISRAGSTTVGSMRAWYLESAGSSLELRDVPAPQLTGGGVVIEVLASHVPAYAEMLLTGARGLLPTPLVLGAGGVGRVLEVADDVFSVAPGDVVVHLGLLRSGEVDVVHEAILGWTGIGGRGVPTPTTSAMLARWPDGTWAERVACPESTLVRLPGAQPQDAPALAYLAWLGVAAEGLEQSGLAAGQTAAVLGATGQLGAAGVLVALARGAATVVAVGRNQAALQQLSALSPRVVPVPLSGDRATDARALVEATGGGPDVVLDALGAVPSPDPTLAGLDALRPGGSMVLVGGVRQDLAVPYGQLMRQRLTLRGSWMVRPRTALAVWDLVRSGLIDLTALRVHEVGMDDPAAALAAAASTSGLEIVVLTP